MCSYEVWYWVFINKIGLLQIKMKARNLCAVVLIGLLFFVTACTNGPRADILTPQEREWLNRHEGKIRFAPSAEYPPIGFIDKDGAYKGITADYLHLIEKRLGFHFAFVICETWDEIIQKAQSGQVDVVGNIQDTSARRAYLRFTKPYLDVPNVIIVSKKVNNELNLGLLRGMKVAMVKNYATIPYVQKNSNDIELIQVGNNSRGLQMVSFGRADAMITDPAVASYYIEQLGITNLKVAGKIDFTWHLAFGTRRDWSELNRILDKGLAAIDDGERQKIYTKWVHLDSRPFDWHVLVFILAGLGAAAVLVALWSLSLRRQVRVKTSQLETELTEKKEAEMALAASEKSYRELVEAANSIILRWDHNGIIRYMNTFGLRFFGYSSEQLIGRDVMTIVPRIEASSGRNLDALVKEIVANPERYTHVPNENITKDGRTVWVAWTNKAIFSKNGEVAEILAIGNDISALKKTEEALVRSEAEQARQRKFLETLLGTTHACIAVMVGHQLRYKLVNNAYQELRRDVPMVGCTYREVFPEAVSSGAEAMVQRVIDTGEPQIDFGFPMPIPGKPDATWDHQIVRMPAEEGEAEQAILVITWDSTEHSRARRALQASEEGLKASLAEKEVLLKEIHHRVKNNMQVISSMVDLQADEVEDPAVRRIFQDVIYRVHSMAMVHEKLYQSPDLARVEFADYAHSLLSYLWRAQGGDAKEIQNLPSCSSLEPSKEACPPSLCPQPNLTPNHGLLLSVDAPPPILTLTSPRLISFPLP